MKNLEELIQLRKSNKFHNIGVNVESVIEVVKKSYYNFEKHSVPSAGAIYGLKVLLFYKNNKKIFNSKGEISTDKFEINQIKKTCFYDDKYFSSSSILIAVTYDYDKYFGKYGNCGVRYASIECGAFLQNFQLLLSEKEIYGCPLGFVDNDALLGIEEPLIYFIIN